MLDKPYDLLVMFGLFAMVVATVGFAITDINDLTATDHNATFFTTINDRTTASTGFKGVTDSSASGLSSQEGAGEEATEENFLLQGFNSLIALGKSWNIVEQSLDEGVSSLGIPPIYLTVIVGLLIVAFAVTIYTWIRGQG